MLSIIKRLLRIIVKTLIYLPRKIVLGVVEIITEMKKILMLKYDILFKKKKRLKKVEDMLNKSTTNFLGICHPEWIGVKNATIDSFQNNYIEIKEIYNNNEAKQIAEMIANSGKKMVAFNAFAYGWDKVAKALKEADKNIEIRLILHGSNALLSETYDWDVFKIMLDLYNEKIIDKLVFIKKSLYEFYKEKGFNALFLMNDVVVKDKAKYIKIKEKIKDNKNLKIGLYCSGERWVKNSYNQISAASLFENAEVDILPISEKTKTICKYYGINNTGVEKNITREEMLERLAGNDINLYVSFTECAPLVPLESLEVGTICITGNNHHYFKGTELEKYLVVNRPDDIMAIYEKMKYALEHKDEIFELYKKWKKDYSKSVEINRKEFFDIK